MRLFLLFSFFFLAASAIDPKDIANRQLTATYNALKSGNQEELFKLLFTSEEDKKHFPEFSKRIQGVSVTLESAMSLPDGNIEAILKVNGIHPAKMVLKQSVLFNLSKL
uniref:DUF3887 domain-containing protein n=1 Tax=Caenorhabditis tropicalis TaxID=1561998 RepID=A0A1I7TD50_9PELO